VIDSEQDAWRELASLWRVPIGEGDPCAQAQRQQVHCFKMNGSLGQIRRLNRPGILTVQGPSKVPAYVLLTALSKDHATLRAGNQSRTLAAAELGTMWRGDFATLWRAPAGYVDIITDGVPGPATEWLAAQLAVLPSAPETLETLAAGGALRSRIMLFQASQGLKPDGLAGPATLMQVNRASGVDEPRLQTER
jgi:general secretion pathway protein A